jgi:hypothetical protein
VILPVSPRLTSSGSSMVSRSSQRRLQILRYAYLVDFKIGLPTTN